MKRIIDIPDNEYRHIKEYYEKNDTVEATYSYIYHGTPLDDVFDKIRAEIASASHGKWYVGRTDGKTEEVLLLDEVLQIIDKYREG